MKIEVGAWLNFEQKDVTYDLCCLYIIEIDKPITWECLAYEDIKHAYILKFL